MIIFEIIQQLKSLRHITVDSGWLEKNKQELFKFISQNPVRRFGATDWGERIFTAAPRFWSFKLVGPVLSLAVLFAVFLGNNFIIQASAPGSLVYSVKLWSENVNCFLVQNSVKKLNCQISQAEKRLEEIQAMLELKGIGRNREDFELALSTYVDKLKIAEKSFVRLAAFEEDPTLIMEAAKEMGRAKIHQELIENVENQAGSALDSALKEAQWAAVEASAQADKQLVRAESVADESAALIDLPSVQEVNEEVAAANMEILNLETVIMTIKSYHGYVVLIGADNFLSQARSILGDARALIEQDQYVEAIDDLTEVSKLIIEAKAEIKKVEPNLNLNLE